MTLVFWMYHLALSILSGSLGYAEPEAGPSVQKFPNESTNTKNYLPQNVNSTKVEKTWLGDYPCVKLTGSSK